MTEISIIGTGNVAFHLSKELSSKKIDFKVFGRNISELKNFKNLFQVETFSLFSGINTQSLVVVCVKDDEIENVVNQLSINQKIVYTSGTLSLNLFKKRKNIGVFYPLQTFSKKRLIDFSQVPILIEANTKEFSDELVIFASKISSRVEFADSETRKKIHLAAVFANNFTNHILNISKNLMEKNNLDWDLLKPLIKETFSKIIEGKNPELLQTGPAKRLDFNTIKIQSDQLDGFEKLIYENITNSIIETHKK
jgi:predicted short-subunit dehydrogenase-like oxidoreductase (DUF2520 family)